MKDLVKAGVAMEKLLVEAQDKINKFEQRDWEIRKELCEIMMNGNNYQPAYRTGSTDVKSWADIKTWLARLTGQVTKEGEMARWINQDRDMETARLWYLIRVTMRDPNLQVPIRQDARLDIFGNEPPRPDRNCH